MGLRIDDTDRIRRCTDFRANPDKDWADLREGDPGLVLSRDSWDEFSRITARRTARCGRSRSRWSPALEDDADARSRGAAAYENFGVFDAVKKSGSGDSVVKLGDASDAVAVAVKATHKGQSNFVVKSLDDDNDSVELLVNEIGNYSGTTLLVLDGEKRLKIDADGPWTITVSPIADMKEIDPPVDGRGDSVVLYSGGAADWKIKHKGESNFVVKQFTDDGMTCSSTRSATTQASNPSGPAPAS